MPGHPPLMWSPHLEEELRQRRAHTHPCTWRQFQLAKLSYLSWGEGERHPASRLVLPHARSPLLEGGKPDGVPGMHFVGGGVGRREWLYEAIGTLFLLKQQGEQADRFFRKRRVCTCWMWGEPSILIGQDYSGQKIGGDVHVLSRVVLEADGFMRSVSRIVSWPWRRWENLLLQGLWIILWEGWQCQQLWGIFFSLGEICRAAALSSICTFTIHCKMDAFSSAANVAFRRQILNV